jgi:hypothetical protein
VLRYSIPYVTELASQVGNKTRDQNKDIEEAQAAFEKLSNQNRA